MRTSFKAEEWKEIPDFPDYEASTWGRIRRSLSCPPGRGSTPGHVMKSSHNNSGYCMVSLRKDGRYFPVTVHKMVAATFIGPRPEGLTINHLDGNKDNNCSFNLEYVSLGQNHKHAYALGLKVSGNQRGERHGLSVLTNNQVIKIKKLISRGVRGCDIARMFGISHATVSHIKAGRTWAHIVLPR